MFAFAVRTVRIVLNSQVRMFAWFASRRGNGRARAEPPLRAARGTLGVGRRVFPVSKIRNSKNKKSTSQPGPSRGYGRPPSYPLVPNSYPPRAHLVPLVPCQLDYIDDEELIYALKLDTRSRLYVKSNEMQHLVTDP